MCSKKLKSAFIASFIFLVCAQSLPRRFAPYAVTYLSAIIGITQDFHTFSPNLKRSEAHLSAYFASDDGSVIEWKYPKIFDLSDIRDRLYTSRYRIFWQHCLIKEPRLWSPFCRFLIDHEKDLKQKTLVSVSLEKLIDETPVINPETGYVATPQPAKSVIIYRAELRRQHEN